MKLNVSKILFVLSAYAGLHTVQGGTCYYTTGCLSGYEVYNIQGFTESGIADIDTELCFENLGGLSWSGGEGCADNPFSGEEFSIGTCYSDTGCSNALVGGNPVADFLCWDILKAGCFDVNVNPLYQNPDSSEGACYFGNNCQEDTALSLFGLYVYLTQAECLARVTIDGTVTNLANSWKQGTIDSTNTCELFGNPADTCYTDCTNTYQFEGTTYPITEALCIDGLNQDSWGTAAATCSGDPHLSTWRGKNKVSWHGECDVVAIDNQDFNNGQGIKVYFRTLRDSFYSFINEIVMKIGTDTVEFHSLGDYKINGVAGSMVNSTSETVAGYKFSHWHSGNVYFHRYVFTFGENGEKIDIKAFENVLYFDVNGGASDAFRNSVGFLGNGKTGDMLGRDGVTHYEDPHEYAIEWQVRDTEEKLFSTDRYPQYPDVCLPANKKKTRLGEMAATKQAEMLCAGWERNKDECIFDVVATRNPLIAEYKTIQAEAIAAQKEQETLFAAAL